MKEERIRVWIKDPGKKPESIMILNELDMLQDLVNGYIETVTLAEDLVIICNEEGRLLGMPHNCRIGGIGFCGPVVIAGVNGEEFASAPGEDALRQDLPQLWKEDA